MPDAVPSPESLKFSSAADTTRSIQQPEFSAAAEVQESRARTARAYDALKQARQYPDKPLDTLTELRAELGRRLQAGESELWCSRTGDQDVTFRLMAAGHQPTDIAKGLNQSSLHAVAKPEPMYGEKITTEVGRAVEQNEKFRNLIYDVTRNKIDLNMPEERRLDKLGLETRVPQRTLNPTNVPVTPKTIAPTFGLGVGSGLGMMKDAVPPGMFREPEMIIYTDGGGRILLE